MEITSVNIVPVSPQKGLVAFASLVLDGVLEIDSIGVYSRLDGKGFRITTPCRKLKNGKLFPYFRPLSLEFEQQILDEISKEIKRIKLFEMVDTK